MKKIIGCMKHCGKCRSHGPYRENRFVRSCIICTNVAESGVTIANVGLVISSGVHRRVSTDIRTGSMINALQVLSKAQVTQQQRKNGED